MGGSTAGADRDLKLGISDILIIGLAALVLALPVLIYGPMVGGHDTYEHLNFREHFVRQFWGGEGYPRWFIGMNHGLGSASFFVYPPLPSYIVALLDPAGKALHFNAFNFMEFLALFGSGISAFVWLGTMASRRAALLVSILYMLMPYHLAGDFYRRTALAECWALVWIPLVLYFTARLKEPDRVALIGLAVSYALMILSHLISVAIISLLPFAITMFLFPRGLRARSTTRVVFGMLLGAGLASFYLLSALFHSRYIPVTRMISVYPFFLEDNVIRFGRALYYGRDFTHTVSLIVINMVVLIVVCATVALRNAQAGQERKNLIFWVTACTIPTFLMTAWSLPVWRMFPFMHRIAQFPWRLNIVLCVAALPIVAAFLCQTSWNPKLNQAVPLALFSLVVFSWLVSYAAIWRRYQTEVATPRTSLSEDDDAFAAWSPPGMDEASALQASTGPRARFLSGVGEVDILLWKSRHLQIETNSPTGGTVMINQFYYPAWTASSVEDGRSLQVGAAMPQGLLQIEIPSGRRQIRLDIPLGSSELIGRWLSAGCILVCGALALCNRRTAQAILLSKVTHGLHQPG
ncbi:MAG: 6-pyruvoyl-tetrahydropterin synthase-related protein [Acidobacteriota bacterium]|nr:6-pyruvoyl-tetrahydropterin synthase-related protein [Acidobacteriota bacterium]